VSIIAKKMETCKKTTNPAYFIEIFADQAGQRLDNFLITHLKGVPKSRIYRMVRTGEVRVNKGRIKPEYRLQTGDRLRVPPLRQGEFAEPVQPGTQVSELLEESVLYEDNGLLVINKPSGMAVHGGSGLSYGVIEALRALRPNAPYLELVHRLDRSTSGCLMIAKKRSVLRVLHALLRVGSVDKRYLALVRGRWQGGKRIIRAALSKNILQSGERMVQVNKEGKQAASVFEPLTLYRDASLMEVQLLSGRTHQIRVHATHSGHPLAGDEKYGDDSFNQTLRSLGLKRLFLHAQQLHLQFPESGQKLDVMAPLGKDLQQVLDKLSSQ
jgi:23S rRNA pseudouridine955/2504/2580 synthase